MRRAIVSTKEGISHPVDDASLVEAKKAAEKVLWLDIQGPVLEDFRLLLDGFGFHPLSIEDSIRRTASRSSATTTLPGVMGADPIGTDEVSSSRWRCST
jgi:Mg2+ and Co2+ transporter CorA